MNRKQAKKVKTAGGKGNKGAKRDKGKYNGRRDKVKKQDQKMKSKLRRQQKSSSGSDAVDPYFNVVKYEKKAADGSGALTTLQSAFERRLQESKFRLLNEKMYALTGSEAETMFAQDPQLFHDYHRGYSFATQNWEKDPVDVIVQYLNQKRMKGKVVADMGCGEAKIAQRVRQKHLRKVHSFDLVALNEHVTACNIAHTPLEDNSVDVVIFCLSLMGTNFYDYLVEAQRVLRMSGLVIVAEPESRIVSKLTLFDVMKKMGMDIEQEVRQDGLFRLFHFRKISEVSKAKRPTTATIDKIFKPWSYKKRDGKTDGINK